MRVGTQLISRRVLDALIKCGAFDSVSAVRAALMAEAENAIKLAQKAQSDAEKNQIGLFGGAVKVPNMAARESVPEWDASEKLKFEKEALGFYITAHPLDKYERELSPNQQSHHRRSLRRARRQPGPDSRRDPRSETEEQQVRQALCDFFARGSRRCS